MPQICIVLYLYLYFKALTVNNVNLLKCITLSTQSGKMMMMMILLKIPPFLSSGHHILGKGWHGPGHQPPGHTSFCYNAIQQKLDKESNI